MTKQRREQREQDILPAEFKHPLLKQEVVRHLGKHGKKRKAQRIMQEVPRFAVALRKQERVNRH